MLLIAESAEFIRAEYVKNYAVDLIREYGIYDSIERYLTTKELKNIFDFYTEEEEKHFKVNFNWFEDAVSK